MATYIEIVEEVKDFLVTRIDLLDESTSFVGDIEAVMNGLYADKDISVGLVVDFLNSLPHANASGDRVRDIWDTNIAGILIAQFEGRDDTEDVKNNLLNALWRAFDGGHSKILSGTDMVSIVVIERPQKTKIGEHPFYYLPFTMKVTHGGK